MAGLPPAWLGSAVLAGSALLTSLGLALVSTTAPLALTYRVLDRTAGTLTLGLVLVTLLLLTRPRPLGTESGHVLGTARLLWSSGLGATWIWVAAAGGHLGACFLERQSTTAVALAAMHLVLVLGVAAGHPWAQQRTVTASAAAPRETLREDDLYAPRPDVGPVLVVLGLALTAVAVSALAPGSMGPVRQLLVLAHVLPATVWVGGLAAVTVAAVALSGDRRYLPWVALLYSQLAGVALLAVAATAAALLGLWLAEHSWGELVGTGDGRLRVAKVVALLCLAASGALHRAVSLTVLERTGSPWLLVWVGAVELVLMGAALALGAGLAVGALR